MDSELEAILRNEIKILNEASELLQHEIVVHKARADAYRAFIVWVYERSRNTLMLKPGFRGFKDERDNALSEINYKAAGIVR